MRKSKPINSSRRQAAALYKQGKRKEAYALWEKIVQDRIKLRERKKEEI